MTNLLIFTSPAQAIQPLMKSYDILGSSIPDWLIAASTIIICVFNIYLWCTARKQTQDTQKALNFSQQSAQAAKQSALAAAGMADLMRSSAVKELRAYISITPKGIIRTDESYTIKMEVQNHGRTPAYNLNMKSKLFVESKNFDAKLFPISYLPHIGILTVNPTQIVNAITDSQENPKEDSLKMISESNSYLFIAAIAEYNDVFGNTYSTEILAKTHGTKFMPSYQFSLCEEKSLQWEYLDVHNRST